LQWHVRGYQDQQQQLRFVRECLQYTQYLWW
jgi:hypothetical protein